MTRVTTSTTATVEILTAEVRVLMVGSRQVTLSVYGQLDSADLADTEPFGRVRPRQAELDYLYLVGRHRETGALVRATVPGGDSSIKKELNWPEYLLAIRQATDRAREHKRRAEQFADSLGESIEQIAAAVGHNTTSRPPGAHPIAAEDAHAEWMAGENALAEARRLEHEYETEAAPLRDQAAGLAELPLIVLAGLR